MLPGHGHRILVVDDTHFFRVMLADELIAAGCAVRTAANLAEARTAIGEWRPDLILLDNHLPDGQGLDLVADVAGQVVPPAIIVLSGTTNLNDRVRALTIGAVDVLTKPYVPEELLARLSRVLAERTRTLRILAERDRLRERASTVERTLLPSSEELRPLLERLWDAAHLEDRPVGVIALDAAVAGIDHRTGVESIVGLWLQTHAGIGQIPVSVDGRPLVVLRDVEVEQLLTAAVELSDGLQAHLRDTLSGSAQVACRYGLAHSSISMANQLDDLAVEAIHRLSVLPRSVAPVPISRYRVPAGWHYRMAN